MTTINKIVEGYNVIEYDKSNIYIIENILEDEFCKKIIKLIEKLPLAKVVHEKHQNVECYIAYTTLMLTETEHTYYVIPMNNQSDQNNSDKNQIRTTTNLNGITHKELQEHVDNISNKIKIITNIMSQINDKIVLDYNSGYNLRKIYGQTKNHKDGILNVQKSGVTFINEEIEEPYKMIRNASLVFALNDDYDGGIFNFTMQNITLKMKKGSVIIFPPYWTHPHEVSSVEAGTFRYTINTWALEQIK